MTNSRLKQNDRNHAMIFIAKIIYTLTLKIMISRLKCFQKHFRLFDPKDKFAIQRLILSGWKMSYKLCFVIKGSKQYQFFFMWPNYQLKLCHWRSRQIIVCARCIINWFSAKACAWDKSEPFLACAFCPGINSGDHTVWIILGWETYQTLNIPHCDKPCGILLHIPKNCTLLRGH